MLKKRIENYKELKTVRLNILPGRLRE